MSAIYTPDVLLPSHPAHPADPRPEADNEPRPIPGVALHDPICAVWEGHSCNCAPVPERHDPRRGEAICDVF